MTKVVLEFNLRLICLKMNRCHFTFNAFHCFFNPKHRVRDKILSRTVYAWMVVSKNLIEDVRTLENYYHA